MAYNKKKRRQFFLNSCSTSKRKKWRKVYASLAKERWQMLRDSLPSSKRKEMLEYRASYESNRMRLYLNSIPVSEKNGYKRQCASKERERVRRKLNDMSFSEKAQYRKHRAASDVKRRFKTYNEKAVEAKGLIEKESEWLLTDQFVTDETQKNVSDRLDCDEYGRHYLGPMNVKCYFCGALGFWSEVKKKFIVGSTQYYHFGDMCCQRGNVKGIRTYNLPPKLEELYTSQDCVSKHFRNHRRTFNSGMAMGLIVGNWPSQNAQGAPWFITCQGELKRFLGSLTFDNKQRNDKNWPKCVQTYFYDPDEATLYRMKNAKGINDKEISIFEETFKLLHQMLIDFKNKYILSFLNVKEILDKYEGNVEVVKIGLHKSQSMEVHEGRTNLPCVDEVAILYPENEGLTRDHKRWCAVDYRQQDYEKDHQWVVLDYKQTDYEKNPLRIIDDTARFYDPLMYPLIYPDGQDGWHTMLKNEKNEKLTMRQHYCYQRCERNDEDGNRIINPINLGRKLGQQWSVRCFVF